MLRVACALKKEEELLPFAAWDQVLGAFATVD
jgi:hypothetical protein